MSEDFILGNMVGYVNDYDIKNKGENHPTTETPIYEEQEVKEFIKILKERIKDTIYFGENNNDEESRLFFLIDKIAGENLC